MAKVINSDQIHDDDSVVNHIEELKDCILTQLDQKVQEQNEFTVNYIDDKLQTLSNALSDKFEESKNHNLPSD